MPWAVALPTPVGRAEAGATTGAAGNDLVELARATQSTDDPRVRQLVAEARANDLVGGQLSVG